MQSNMACIELKFKIPTRVGHSGQDCYNIIVMTGQQAQEWPEQGQPGHESQDMKARIEQLRQDNRERTPKARPLPK
jgi:hypothetical protein